MLANYLEPEDILADENFLSWYFKTEASREQAWEEWMSAHPDSKELVMQAVQILDNTRLREKELAAGQLEKAESRLFKSISLSEAAAPYFKDQDQPSTRKEPSADQAIGIADIRTLQTKPVPRFKWGVAAAALIILAGGALLTGSLLRSKPELKTQFGEIIRQQLPDGTEVTMNANSRLDYFSEWKDGKDREVWVKGEAYFHVTKTQQHSRFIVHTSHFDVIVTGTQFNVLDRHEKGNVLLQEGSVTIMTKEGKMVQLTPGEFAEFGGDRQVDKRPARQDSVTAWKEQKLIFDHTPLREIVNIIDDQYGVAVKLADDSVGNKTVCGIMPNNNLDVLLQAIQATADFNVKKEKGAITISSQKARE